MGFLGVVGEVVRLLGQLVCRSYPEEVLVFTTGGIFTFHLGQPRRTQDCHNDFPQSAEDPRSGTWADLGPT